MKLEKWAMRLVNLLLTAFFAFAILAFLEQFSRTGWTWYSRSLRAWPLLLAFPIGLVSRALGRWKLPLLALSVLLCGLVMALLWPAWSFLEVFYLVCALVLAAAAYFLGLRGEEPFPARLAVASLLVYLGACVYFFLGDYELRDFQPLCWCGLGSFCLSLYSFNTASLHTGVHNMKGGESMAIPAGIRGRNLLLLTGFLLLAVLVGSIGAVRQGLAGLWHWIVMGIAGFIRFLANVSGGDTPRMSSATPEPSPLETEETGLANLVEDGDPTFIIVYGILLALGGVVFLLLALGFIREGRKGGIGHRFSDWVKGLFQTKEVLEYKDDVERTADLRDILAQRRERARRWVRKLREKPERYEDMPDDRMRLRFVYWSLLRSGRVSGWTSAATPKEVGAGMKTPAFQKLGDAYSAARYDLEHPVPPEALAAGEEALQVLKRRGK